LTRYLVETPAEAERTRFHGSPSPLLDGVDVFAEPCSKVGVSCRRYLTPDGYEGVPTLEQLWAVLGPMRDRIATIGPIAAASAFGLCCGLPLLLSMGVVGALAGWSLQSWALIGVGLALASVGWARWAVRRRHDQTCHRSIPPTHVDLAPVQTAEITTGISTDATMGGIKP